MPSLEKNPIFTDADAAREYLEAQRWPDGPYCPHCGNADQGRIAKVGGTSARPGVYNCKECRKQFTVTVGTVYERSHIPLNTWLLATFLLCSSKKGMSTRQFHRMLGVSSLKTAWFMMHRIRESMKDDVATPIGGQGKVVEADETYFGNKENVIKRTKKGKSGHGSKRSVVALVERGGKARMIHVERADKATINQIIVENVAHETRILTDESRLYGDVGTAFEHETVKHSAGEYARYDEGFTIHTNTVEAIFSVFKRGMHGVYQHCGEAHLHRYLNEFAFRHNTRIM